MIQSYNIKTKQDLDIAFARGGLIIADMKIENNSNLIEAKENYQMASIEDPEFDFHDEIVYKELCRLLEL